METKRKRDGEEQQIPHSLFLSTTIPDINKQIADFLQFAIIQALQKKVTLCQNKNLTNVQIEIEAKFGSLVSKQTGKRLDLPVISETILNDQMIMFNFISNMTMSQHSQFNQLLNYHTSQNSKLKYTHTRIVDEFLNVPQLGKCRRSIDQATNQTLYMIMKTKVADLHILVPNSPFDIRVTVNLESTVKPDFEGKVSIKRKKDRMCYKMFPFEVDLTQNGETDTKHELELEFIEVDEFVAEIQESKYSKRSMDYINAFVHNIRYLNNAARKMKT